MQTLGDLMLSLSCGNHAQWPHVGKGPACMSLGSCYCKLCWAWSNDWCHFRFSRLFDSGVFVGLLKLAACISAFV